MFTSKLWTRYAVAIRIILIAVMIFNALAPTTAAALASSSPEQAASASVSDWVARLFERFSPGAAFQDVTPTVSAVGTDTPTPAFTFTSTIESTPTRAEILTPPILETATTTPAATLTPSLVDGATETAISSPTGTPTAIDTLTVTSQPPALSFKLFVAPEQAAPGDEVTFTIEIVNNGETAVTGLLFSNILPEGFGSGQAGFQDFDFDPRTHELTWDGTKSKAADSDAELLPGELLTLEYALKVETKTTEVQLIDTATLTADGLETPLLAEATLTILGSDNNLTAIDTKGGEAVGLDGCVEVSIPDQALDAPGTILIEDLSQKEELQPKVKDQPWLVFSLEMSVPQTEDAELLSAPVINEAIPQSEDIPTATLEAPEELNENLLDENLTPTPESFATPSPMETVIPNADDEEPSQESDRLIPLGAVDAKFDEPVELTISFDGIINLATLGADKMPFIVTLDEASKTWVRVPLKSIDLEANTITAETTHFSIWGAGIGPAFPTNGGSVLLFDQALPDLFTGRARYSVPIWTPPGRNGMAPSLALSYSSGTADGILGHVQAPWVGMGWNVDSVEIARKITNCIQCDPQNYGYENKFLLLFNGTGYELIPDGTTPGRYHTKSESFLFIQLHNDDLGNNSPTAQNTTGEWWEVVERDGTRWRLGWNNHSEQRSAMIGYPGDDTGNWASLGYAGHALDVVTYRWRVDQVTDTHGNRMTFTYSEEVQEHKAVPGVFYDRASYMDTIAYTFHTSGSPLPGYSVVFVREGRDSLDMPPDPVYPGENYDTERLDRIEVKYGANIVRTYDLGYNLRSYSDDGKSWYVPTLTSLLISGGSVNLPTLSFVYTDKDNRANCGSGCQEWAYPRLQSVSNGWGGTVSYTYGNDNRPSTRWYNWRVETLDVYDGVNASPMKTTYAYSVPCYNDTSAGWCNTSNIGELIGYGQTTETAKDFDGSSVLSIILHKFYTGSQQPGREYETQRQNNSGTILSQTLTNFATSTTGLPAGGYFTYPVYVDEILRDGSSLPLISRTENTYNTSTGNVTSVKEYNGALTLYRQTDYEYVTNTSPSVWILDTVSRVMLKNASGTILSEQQYGYDGNLPGSGSPTVGKLTLSRVVDGTQTIDTTHIYDTYGNVTETRRFESYGSTGSQPSGSYLSSVTDYDSLETYSISTDPPLIPATTTNYDFGLGLPTTVTDPNGNTTTTAYDGLGRVTSITYPGFGQPNVKYTYPTPPVSAPFMIKGEMWDQTASTYRSAWQIMDGLGRVVQTQGPYETAGYLVLTDTSYNAQGLTLNSGLPRTLSGAGGSYFTPAWVNVPHTTTSYDALGRTTSVAYPDSSAETFSYSGLRTTVIDRNSHQKVEETDAFGRLAKVEEYTGSSTYTLYATTSYTYDPRDLLTTVMDNEVGLMTSINYDGFGRKDSMSDPDMGVWSYEYDVLGKLHIQTDARNCVITVEYDDLNRPISKTYTGPGACDSTPDVTYTYDDTTGGNEGIGRRTGMTDGSGSTTWFYNVLGQVTNQTQNLESTNYSVSATFDAFNRPLTQTLPSGEVLNYAYNAMGTLSSLSGTSTYVSQIHYTASGQVSDQVLGNNLLQQSCYETNTLRLKGLRVYPGATQGCETNPAGARLNLSYSYQPNGNVGQVTDSTRSETLNYTYDELDRLLSVNGPYGQSYTYDSIGNLTAKSSSQASPLIMITKVTTGFNHSCALTNNGGVICWGNNDAGQLGDGTNSSRGTPVAVIGLSSGVVDIEAGGFHTCAITSSGGLKCWGQNTNGVLGDNTSQNRNTPVDVSGLTSGVAAVSAGYDNTCALTTSGGVKCWGNNSNGGVGDGTTTTPRLTPQNVSGLTSGVTAIATGIRHSCALTSSGGVKCWGQNVNGQLGDNSTTNRNAPVNVSGLTSGVSAISAGESHTCALTTGGGVKCWGANGDGQLGDNSTTQRLTPVDVNSLTSGVAAISAGNFHTCARTTGGGLKCWGRNAQAQLGDGTTTTPRLTPVNVSGLTSGTTLVASGISHSCAVTTSGWVKCWGENYTFSRLGDSTTLLRTTAVSLSGSLNGGSRMEAGGFHTCTVGANGGASCWGYNNAGQLGDNSATNRTTPVSVTGLTSGVVSISAGYLHTCALTTAGSVKCWGDNFYGQLGNNSTTNSSVPVQVSGLTSGVVAITVGARHSCALTASGGVKCWGQNFYGQLGDNSTAQRLTPVDVTGLTSGVGAISAGELHTCALTVSSGVISGGVKCWGTNTNGQLGDNSTTQRLTPVNVSGLTSGVTAISAGNFQTCALTTGGGVKCWGNNYHGQLGDGTTTQRLVPVNVSNLTSGVITVVSGIDQTCAQTDTSGMKCWGYNVDGRLGDGTTTERTMPVDVSGLSSGVITVTTGFAQSCALTSTGQKCWGGNGYGQVGDGTTIQRLTAVSVVTGTMASYNYGDANHKHAVTSLSTGESYTYDANGNMTQRVEGGLTYTQVFDAENRLVSVTVSGQTTQFVYDGDGNLVKKVKPDGSRTLYVGGVYEVDKNAGGSVTKTATYYPASGAMRVNSTLYYVLKDHLGSASVVTDASGTIVGEDRFYPYGETRFTTGTLYTDKLFTGQREMAGLGIYDYGARFYSPKLGRFLSADTSVPGFANPQNLNRFSYVNNNPLRYVDPSGHRPCDDVDSYGRCITAPKDNGSSKGSSSKTRGARKSGEGGTYNVSNPPILPDPKLKILPVSDLCPGEYALVQCAYSGKYYKPYEDVRISSDEFNNLALAIFFDLKNREPVGGYDYRNRSTYDTPLWDSYGAFTGKVCIGANCYKRSEFNYLAQGMWVAASDQSLVEGEAGVWAWKSCSLINMCTRPLDANYWPPIPSEGTIYWFDVGYNIYNALNSSYPYPPP